MNKNAHMATFRLTESSLMDMGLPLYKIWYALLDFDAGTVVEEILAFSDELTLLQVVVVENFRESIGRKARADRNFFR